MKEQSMTLKKNIYRLLWVGVSLFVISVVLLLVLDTDSGHQYMLGLLMNRFASLFGRISLVLLVGVLLPCFEEIAFRFWTIGKKSAYVISSILMAGYAWLFFSWWLALVVVALFWAICCVKERNCRILLMAVFSSVVFAAMHLDGFGYFSIGMLLSSFQLMGLALILCSIALLWGLRWAMVVHSANNVMALLLSFVPLTFQSDNYEFSLKEFFGNGYACEEQQGDTLVYRSSLPEIANFLMIDKRHSDSIDSWNANIFYRTDSVLSAPYELRIVPKMTQRSASPTCGAEAKEKILYDDVVRELEKQGFLDIDTTYEPLYFLSVADDSLLLSRQGTSPISELFYDVWIQYDIPLQSDGAMNPEFPICQDKPLFKVMDSLDFSDFQVYIRKNYGLSIWRSEHRRVQVVSFMLP